MPSIEVLSQAYRAKLDEIAQRYDYKSLAEMAERLDEPEDYCMGLLKSWGHELPANPEVLQRYARNFALVEYYLRGLVSDKNAGRITEEEFQEKAREIEETKFFDF